MLSKINSCGLLGIDGYIVEVEIDIAGGMPGFEKLGKHSQENHTVYKRC